MITWHAKLLSKQELILGEGAHWHYQWKKFLFTDIMGKKIGIIDPVSLSVEFISLPSQVGTIVPCKNGQLIVALQGSIAEYNPMNGELNKLCSIEEEIPANRSNDGKCDAMGRFWVGTMDCNAKMHKGSLYCYDGVLTKKLRNVSVSNGICWSPDNTTMYYIDSLDHNIKAYDYDLENSNISNERVIVRIDNPSHLPDGMTIDSEGMIWVAIWGGGCVNRYNPINGDIIGTVLVDAPHVTSCAFGGDDHQELFITTAKTGLSETQLENYPLSGSLFIVNTGITGGNQYFFSDMIKS